MLHSPVPLAHDFCEADELADSPEGALQIRSPGRQTRRSATPALSRIQFDFQCRYVHQAHYPSNEAHNQHVAR